MRDYYDIIGPLELPIGGKVYTVPPVSAPDGAQLRLAGEGKPSARFKKLTGTQVTRMVLGSAYDEMVADNVDPAAMDRAFLAAMAEFRSGRDAAERAWEAGASPELIAAMRAAAEMAAKKTSSTGTASAKKTPSRASTRRTGQKPVA